MASHCDIAGGNLDHYFSSGVSTEKTVISAARLPMMTNLWNRMMRLISALKVANSFRISARNSVV